MTTKLIKRWIYHPRSKTAATKHTKTKSVGDRIESHVSVGLIKIHSHPLVSSVSYKTLTILSPTADLNLAIWFRSGISI